MATTEQQQAASPSPAPAPAPSPKQGPNAAKRAHTPLKHSSLMVSCSKAAYLAPKREDYAIKAKGPNADRVCGPDDVPYALDNQEPMQFAVPRIKGEYAPKGGLGSLPYALDNIVNDYKSCSMEAYVPLGTVYTGRLGPKMGDTKGGVPYATDFSDPPPPPKTPPRADPAPFALDLSSKPATPAQPAAPPAAPAAETTDEASTATSKATSAKSKPAKEPGSAKSKQASAKPKPAASATPSRKANGSAVSGKGQGSAQAVRA